MKTFYITTPIYYANSQPHMGSLYTTLVADTLARYKRQRGFETYFLTGTDEHGINIQRVAKKNGVMPKEYVDRIVREFERVFADFHLDTAHGGYDIFMRTTNPFHYEGVSRLWRTVRDARTPKGREPIYKGFYEGWFCPQCAAYKTEDEYEKSDEPDAAPSCLIHLTALDRVAEESYFFRLSDYGETLLALYEQQPELIQPESRRNEVLSFIKRGLEDLSISRPASSISWGIPVPDDPTPTVYVWFDALSNYITAIGYGNEERESKVGFEKFWQNAVHIVGNDILRFHTIYWHSFLLAADLHLPKTVFAHGMLVDAEGRKWSKTLGNAVYLDDLKPYFTPDVLRYFCLRHVVFGQDGRISYETLIERTNSDLASGFGNLASRTLTMINRYCEGLIPSGEIKDEARLLAKRAGIDTDAAQAASILEHARDEFAFHFDNFNFNRALETVWTAIARTDKFLSDTKPWELAKNPEQREILNAVLYRAAETLRWLAVLLYPVMPEATANLWRQLGQEGTPEQIDPANLRWGDLREETRIGTVEAIFPRIDKGKTMAEIEKGKAVNQTNENSAVEKISKNAGEHSGTHATEADAVQNSNITSETQPEPPMRGATEADAVPHNTTQSATQSHTAAAQSPGMTGAATSAQQNETENVVSLITIDDFVKVEMRVGEILEAERVPKADKLLRLVIDLGEAQPRQILAGIAQYYEPEALIKRKVAVVSNLQPRKLRGFESNGMVLAASYGEEGRPALATFSDDVPNGARLK